jgi:hypothetical protein
MNDDTETTKTTDNTEDDDRHVDLNVMLMGHSEYKKYSLSLRPSMNNFLKSNEEKYKNKDHNEPQIS